MLGEAIAGQIRARLQAQRGNSNEQGRLSPSKRGQRATVKADAMDDTQRGGNLRRNY
jgi:hypothetical protein